MNYELAVQIRALANAIEATDVPERIIAHLKDLRRITARELRKRGPGETKY